MHNYIAVVFKDTTRAYAALHALWQLDNEGAAPLVKGGASGSVCRSPATSA